MNFNQKKMQIFKTEKYVNEDKGSGGKKHKDEVKMQSHKTTIIAEIK